MHRLGLLSIVVLLTAEPSRLQEKTVAYLMEMQKKKDVAIARKVPRAGVIELELLGHVGPSWEMNIPLQFRLVFTRVHQVM